MAKQFITWTEVQTVKRKKAVVLKPCPFCGSRAEFRLVGYKSVAYGLRCTGCKIITPVKGGPDGQLRATAFWNQRIVE